MNCYAPLFNFGWNGQECNITPYLSIKKNPYNFNEEDKSYLSAYEVSDASECPYWAKINDKKPDDLDPRVIFNGLLLSMWISGPTDVQTKFWFNELEDGGQVSRILSRFHGDDQNSKVFGSDDLANIAQIFQQLMRIEKKGKRLKNVMLYTFLGATAEYWSVAFVLYTAALEAMLTYSRNPGITKRLAKSFACITERGNRKRNSCYRRFVKIYDVRSDIMHGRVKRSSSSANSKRLLEVSNFLRKLWKIVLQDRNYMAVLDGSDAIRESFLNKLEVGYTAPKV